MKLSTASKQPSPLPVPDPLHLGHLLLDSLGTTALAQLKDMIFNF